MYNEDAYPKIHSLTSNEVELETCDSFQNGRSHIQESWVNAITAELSSIAAFDPRPRHPQAVLQSLPEKKFFNHDRKWAKIEEFREPEFPVLSDSIMSCHASAAEWDPGQAGVDLRPHVFDAAASQFVLLDSGSQVSAYPPEPGDQESGTFLKAVNGSRIKCFGFKQITIKIGRKEYHHKVIKANVSSPVLGWDFIRQNKLDFVWNEFGDITIRDKKANINATLTYKAIPLEQSIKLKKLAKVDGPVPLGHPGVVGLEACRLVAQIAAVENLGVEEKQKVTLESMPNSPYKQLIQKYSDLLVQKFDTEESKSGVIHRIITKPDAKPCRAKVRRLLPGSPKEKLAKEAWFELIKLGIVEKVDPSVTNT